MGKGKRIRRQRRHEPVQPTPPQQGAVETVQDCRSTGEEPTQSEGALWAALEAYLDGLTGEERRIDDESKRFLETLEEERRAENLRFGLPADGPGVHSREGQALLRARCHGIPMVPAATMAEVLEVLAGGFELRTRQLAEAILAARDCACRVPDDFIAELLDLVKADERLTGTLRRPSYHWRLTTPQ